MRRFEAILTRILAALGGRRPPVVGAILVTIAALVSASDTERRPDVTLLRAAEPPVVLSCDELAVAVDHARERERHGPEAYVFVQAWSGSPPSITIQCNQHRLRATAMPLFDTGGAPMGPARLLVRVQPGGLVVDEVCLQCTEGPTALPDRIAARRFAHFVAVVLGSAGLVLWLLIWLRRVGRSPDVRRALGDAPDEASPNEARSSEHWSATQLPDGPRVEAASARIARVGDALAPSAHDDGPRIELGATAGYRQSAVGSVARLVGPGAVNGLRVREGGSALVHDGDVIRLGGGSLFRIAFPDKLPGTSIRYHHAPGGRLRLLRREITIAQAGLGGAALAAAIATGALAQLEAPYWLPATVAALAVALGLAMSLRPGLRATRVRTIDPADARALTLREDPRLGTLLVRAAGSEEEVLEELPIARGRSAEEDALLEALRQEARALAARTGAQ
jgi:hypothetical protein